MHLNDHLLTIAPYAKHPAGKTTPKQTLVSIIVVSKDNLEKVLPTIERTVFAYEVK